MKTNLEILDKGQLDFGWWEIDFPVRLITGDIIELDGFIGEGPCNGSEILDGDFNGDWRVIEVCFTKTRDDNGEVKKDGELLQWAKIKRVKYK